MLERFVWKIVRMVHYILLRKIHVVLEYTSWLFVEIAFISTLVLNFKQMVIMHIGYIATHKK
jgi:hypothetical protein